MVILFSAFLSHIWATQKALADVEPTTILSARQQRRQAEQEAAAVAAEVNETAAKGSLRARVNTVGGVTPRGSLILRHTPRSNKYKASRLFFPWLLTWQRKNDVPYYPQSPASSTEYNRYPPPKKK